MIDEIEEKDLDLSKFSMFSEFSYSDLGNILFEINLLEHSHQDYGYNVVNCDSDGLYLDSKINSDRYVLWEVSDTCLDVAKKVYKLFIKNNR